jgi:hypothetical protein
MILPTGALSASVQALTLAQGLHLVCVTSASPQRLGGEAELILPAVHVDAGSGVPAGQVEFLTGPRNNGNWLFETRDMLVVKVLSSEATILVTTVKAGAHGAIAVEVTRLSGNLSGQGVSDAAVTAPALVAPGGTELAMHPAVSAPGLRTPSGRPSLSTRVDLHIARKGDVAYINNYWAGALGERLPIEAFAISPLEDLRPDQLEYSAVAAAGGETGWIEGGRLCGSRGAAAALAGFAVRLKREVAGDYECEYRGSFSSGRIVGPVRDGALCASDPDDRLEAIQVFLLRHGQSEPASNASLMIAGAPAAEEALVSALAAETPRRVGPRFSVFRENVG